MNENKFKINETVETIIENIKGVFGKNYPIEIEDGNMTDNSKFVIFKINESYELKVMIHEFKYINSSYVYILNNGNYRLYDYLEEIKVALENINTSIEKYENFYNELINLVQCHNNLLDRTPLTIHRNNKNEIFIKGNKIIRIVPYLDTRKEECSIMAFLEPNCDSPVETYNVDYQFTMNILNDLAFFVE